MKRKSNIEIADPLAAPFAGRPKIANKWAVGVCIGLSVLSLIQPLTVGVARAESTSSQSSVSHVQTGNGSSSGNVSIGNGAVTIDGEAVPADAHEFTSRKGNHFRIDHHGSSVEVHQD
jgi:hypothetical protein